jgi:hypothetical protein
MTSEKPPTRTREAISRRLNQNFTGIAIASILVFILVVYFMFTWVPSWA